MKYYLLRALLLVSLGEARAQVFSTHIKPQLHDNLILLQTQDSAATALRKLAEIFVGQGYTLEQLSSESLVLSRKPIFFARHNNATVLIAHAMATTGANSQLTLQTTFEHTPLITAQKRVGMEKQDNRAAFVAIEKAALAYPGGKLSYGRR